MLMFFQEELGEEEPADVVAGEEELFGGGVGDGEKDLHVWLEVI